MMPLMSYKEMAEFSGIKIGTLYALVSQNKIPHVRFGARHVMFDRGVIEKWISLHHVRATPSSSNK